MIKVVIDTDPGTDDALALMMALNSPELEIQGLTTVGGNATLRHTTANALRLVEYVGRPHMPVSQGSARPLKGRFNYGYQYHGSGGLNVRLPRPKGQPRPLRAPEYLISLGYSFPGELVLITLGPLTNVARAIQKEPQLKEWIKEIVVMGGAVGTPGNVTPYAEFNIYNDPRAAQKVVSSGIPILLVGLDVCNQVYLTAEEVASFQVRSHTARLARRIVSNWFRLHPQRERYLLFDPLAVAAAIQPTLLSSRQTSARVEVDDPERLGQTVVEREGGPIRVATEVDVEGFKDLFYRLLGLS